METEIATLSKEEVAEQVTAMFGKMFRARVSDSRIIEVASYSMANHMVIELYSM